MAEDGGSREGHLALDAVQVRVAHAAPAWSTRRLRLSPRQGASALGPAGSPEAALSARRCPRLPQVSASLLGQSAAWAAPRYRYRFYESNDKPYQDDLNTKSMVPGERGFVGEAACGVWGDCRYEPQPCLRLYPRCPRPPFSGSLELGYRLGEDELTNRKCLAVGSPGEGGFEHLLGIFHVLHGRRCSRW